MLKFYLMLYIFSAFLIKYLEQRSCELGLNTKWVFSLILETGLPPPRVMEIYDRLFKSKVFSILVWFMVLNATFNSISIIPWQSVLLVDLTGVLGENHRPVATFLHVIIFRKQMKQKEIMFMLCMRT